MPRIIHFTDSEMMQGKLIEVGQYPAVIFELDGPKPSSTGKSENIWAKFRISEGKYKGKELSVTFNSERTSSDLYQGIFWAPRVVLTEQIARAILGKSPQDLDLDDLLDKPLIISVKMTPKPDNTGIINVIDSYLPVGQKPLTQAVGAGMPPAPVQSDGVSENDIPF